MKVGRLLLSAVLCVAAVAACSYTIKPVQSTAQLKKAYWGVPQAGGSADVTAMVSCPGGYPCDVPANGSAFGDTRTDLNKRLTVIWTCQPQNFVLAEIAPPTFKVHMACVGEQPTVPRRIDIVDANWTGPDGRPIDVTQIVRDICSDGPMRCQVPAVANIFGAADRGTKTLRIRYTCNGERTASRQATENSIADLRCERISDLSYPT
jgi:hypothetical protein